MNYQSIVVQHEIAYRLFRLRQKYVEVNLTAILTDLQRRNSNNNTQILLSRLVKVRRFIIDSKSIEVKLKEIQIHPSFHIISAICEYLLRCGFDEEAKVLLVNTSSSFKELDYLELERIMLCCRSILNSSMKQPMEFIQSNSSRLRDISSNTLLFEDKVYEPKERVIQSVQFFNDASKICGLSSISSLELHLSCGLIALKTNLCLDHDESRSCPVCKDFKVISNHLQSCRRSTSILRCACSNQEIENPHLLPTTPTVSLVSSSTITHLCSSDGRYVLLPSEGIAVARNLIKRVYIS